MKIAQAQEIEPYVLNLRTAGDTRLVSPDAASRSALSSFRARWWEFGRPVAKHFVCRPHVKY